MNPFLDIRLGLRLSLGFAVVMLLVACMAAMSLFSLGQVREQGDGVVTALDRVDMADRWTAMTQLNVSRTLAIAQSSNAPVVKSFFDPLIKDTSRQIGAVQKQLESSAVADADKTRFTEIAARRKRYIATRDVIFKALDAGDPDVMKQVTATLIPAANSYLAAIGDFASGQRLVVDNLVRENAGNISRVRIATVVFLLLCAAIGALCATFITRSVTDPLRRALVAVGAIAEGDLGTAIEVGGRDEVGDLLRGLAAMQGRLRTLIADVRGSTGSVQVTSRAVAQGSLDLSTRTEQAAANLQQTSASMEQISTSVRHAAASAQMASELVARASAVTAAGGQVVARMMTAMSQISSHSGKISEIIGVIDGIAFQTNILALNAAVEAARAGSQGRGFAVVAGEVRHLAQRSGVAAREIRALIAVSADVVERGNGLVLGTGESMTEIGAAVERVAAIVGEIQVASSAQSEGLSQISAAVSLMDRNTQQNAALVEQTASAAGSLNDQVRVLAQAVSSFRAC